MSTSVSTEFLSHGLHSMTSRAKCGLFRFRGKSTLARDDAFNTHSKHGRENVNPHLILMMNMEFSTDIWAEIVDDHLIEPFIPSECRGRGKKLMFLQEML
ncbi:hypothetical protein AVEN_191849-1 [Araneus ventricosus]|uniref:Uncharacterized protein n=1 Tax=Araneus ventricosus TaxID=182803 RepID=A0A4Y2F2F7_ARAVE|nr:hypothetical protein AVEN_191849-1 [Araneus ventricosus]